MTEATSTPTATLPGAGTTRRLLRGVLAAAASVFVFGKTGSPEYAAAAGAGTDWLLSTLGELARQALAKRGYELPERL